MILPLDCALLGGFTSVMLGWPACRLQPAQTRAARIYRQLTGAASSWLKAHLAMIEPRQPNHYRYCSQCAFENR